MRFLKAFREVHILCHQGLGAAVCGGSSNPEEATEELRRSRCAINQPEY